ncbi:MAG: hypothetical protein EHM26_01575 [Desulfobacteraceae bacterium]|nr:MAG: hypothetical protein EHM26_01575 [Desulfobacteraceae bacterium]
MRGPQKISRPLVGGGSWWGFACLLLAFMLLIPASCGRKARPSLPQKTTSARVLDLKGAWQGEYVELKGSVSDSSGLDQAVTGARVHYAIYPVADPPCDGCPIEFQGFHTYGTEVIREERFFCKIPGALKGNIYYFEVQLTGDKGSPGPPSNRAKVIVE